MRFADFNRKSALLNALAGLGFESPAGIQRIFFVQSVFL